MLADGTTVKNQRSRLSPGQRASGSSDTGEGFATDKGDES